MKRFAVLLLLPAVATALTGCGPQKGPTGGGLPGTVGELIPVSQPTNGDNQRFFLVVRLRMASVELPVGKASGSEELWSYLDEEPHGAAGAVGLGLNGFRVGVGSGDSWPDLVKALEKLTGQKFMETHVLMVPGRPVPIRLKERQPEQTVFTFHPDRTLSGADYPPGDNLLTVTCTLNADDPSAVLITGVPQIRSRSRRTKYVRKPGGFTVVPERTYYSFRPLTFQLPVLNGDFVMVGPGVESRRADSVGHYFLVRKKKGLEFETVLILVPEVFRSPFK